MFLLKTEDPSRRRTSPRRAQKETPQKVTPTKPLKAKGQIDYVKREGRVQMVTDRFDLDLNLI